jgi:hypothetical protein
MSSFYVSLCVALLFYVCELVLLGFYFSGEFFLLPDENCGFFSVALSFPFLTPKMGTSFIPFLSPSSGSYFTFSLCYL